MADRKKSPLASDTAPWEDEPLRKQRKPAAAPPAAAAAPTPKAPAPEPQPAGEPGQDQAVVVRIQEGSRKRLDTRSVDPFELRPVNCNLPLITRRETRKFAAEHEVDIQDVINDALIRYLALFGIHVPRTRAEYEQNSKAL